MDRQARTIRYLRVSLTDRCNYRCTYCMPAGDIDYGPRDQVLTLEEVVQVCAAFAQWGVRRVRLTGGEPTLRRGLVELVRALGRLPTDTDAPLEVVMTTNGERLESLAQPLREAGLRSLTVSLDSLDPQRFRTITRRGNLSAVLAGMQAARAAGFASLKLNTVAVRGFNDDELGSIARFAWSHDVVPRFIEVMPMAAGELFVPGALMPAEQIRAAIAADVHGDVVLHTADAGDAVRGLGPASYFRIVGGAHHGRRFGTIGAMTENFCHACNRLRLSATGQLHACLARDETGDLRAVLRSSPGELQARVQALLGTKRDGHGFNIDGSGGPAKTMVSIGG